MKELQTELKPGQTDHGPGAPRYAIVRLAPKDDVFNLFRLLVQNGYQEVSFVNGLKDTVLPWPLAGAMKCESLHNASDTSSNSPKNHSSLQSDSNSDSEGGNGHSGSSAHHPTVRRNESFISVSSSGCFASDQSTSKTTLATLPVELMCSNSNTRIQKYSSPVTAPPSISSLVPAFPPRPPPIAMSSFGCPRLPLNVSMSREVVTPPYSVPNPISTCSSGIPMFQKFPSMHPPPPPLQMVSSSRHPAPVTTTFCSPVPNPLMPPIPQAPLIPLTTPATTQLRQRGSRAQSDDPSVYVACRLCNNKIMASRLSNLTNHVRRHSTLKQFQCCYCDYTHNEMAKVRLHMLHNHKDKDSQPIDNLSPEMQSSWDVLMQQCFPDHYQGGPGANQGLGGVRGRHQGGLPPPVSTPGGEINIKSEQMKPEILREINTQLVQPCFECGEIINPPDRLEHIRQNHIECFPYVCSLCGYDHPEQGKVLLHITLKHGDNTSAQTPTETLPGNTNGAENHRRSSHGTTQQHMDVDNVQVLTENHSSAPNSPTIMPNQPTQQHFQSLNTEMNLGSAFQSLPVTTVDMESSEDTLAENLKCQLCRKVLEGVRPLSSLLNHAKRHYHLKQFQCVQCPYSSSEAAHVRSHMKLKHSVRGKAPLDNRSPTLQLAWMQTMARCFPSMAPRLKKFRFKNFRNKPSGRPSRAKRTSEGSLSNKANGDSLNGSDFSGHEPAGNSSDTAETLSSSPAPNSENGNRSKSDSPSSSLENSKDFQVKSFKSSDLPLNKRQCRLCERWVTTEDLFLHATTHITLKPFGCSVCPFRTNDYQHLRAHLWKHKLISGERHKARIAANNSDMASLRSEYVTYCFGEQA